MVFCVLRMESPKVLKRDRKSAKGGDDEDEDSNALKRSTDSTKSQFTFAVPTTPEVSATPKKSAAPRELEKAHSQNGSDTDASEDDMGETILVGGPPVKKLKGDPFDSARAQHNAMAAEAAKRPIKKTPQPASARKHSRASSTAPTTTLVPSSVKGVTAVRSLGPQVVIPSAISGNFSVQSLGRPADGPRSAPPELQAEPSLEASYEIVAGQASDDVQKPDDLTEQTLSNYPTAGVEDVRRNVQKEEAAVEALTDHMEVDESPTFPGTPPVRQTALARSFQFDSVEYTSPPPQSSTPLANLNDDAQMGRSPAVREQRSVVPTPPPGYNVGSVVSSRPSEGRHPENPRTITFMVKVDGTGEKRRYITVNNDISWASFYYKCVVKADSEQKHGIVDAKVMRTKIPLGVRNNGELIYEEEVIDLLEDCAETQWRVLVRERLKDLEYDQGVGVIFSN